MGIAGSNDGRLAESEGLEPDVDACQSGFGFDLAPEASYRLVTNSSIIGRPLPNGDNYANCKMLPRFLLTLFLVLVGFLEPVMAGNGPLRFGVTPAILHDQYMTMAAFRQYLERKTGRVVQMVPRNRYGEMLDLVKHREVEFAWVSAAPYVYARRFFRAQLVAVPIMNGQPSFRAYLIVPAEDRVTGGLLQLEGRIFAYADPYSCTGFVVPRYELKAAGRDPGSFFGRTFFTFGHKKSIRAVASHLADAAYVDSLVWDALSSLEPELTAATRIVARSREFGAPPIVATDNVGRADVAAVRRALLDMAGDAEGMRVLKLLRMDGFAAGDPKAYAEVERMMRETGDL